MKILHINSYYDNCGIPSFYKHLFEALLSKGVDISVLVPVAYEMEERNKREFGSYSHVVKAYNKWDRYLFFPKQNKILQEAKSCFTDISYDIIHAHSLFSNGYVANRLHHCFGIPYIVAVRNTDINVFFRFMLHLRKLGIRILLEADQIIFVSESYKLGTIDKIVPFDLKKIILKKSTVLPNGVDKFWLENSYSRSKRFSNSNLHILTVGQVSKNKNQITVLRTAEILKSRGYNVHCTIIGAVKDKAMQEKIQKHPLAEYIPPKTKEELLSFYRKADVFVLPSKTETFGLVYAEAMTQSLPIIYTRGQGFDRQFDEGTVGYHVDHANPVEIADRVEDILSKYDTIAKNCIRLSERYDWRKITESYIEVYEKCLDNMSCSGES